MIPVVLGAYEEQHILTLLVTEVLSDGKTSKGDTGTGSGGLIHLTEHQGDLGLSLKLNDTWNTSVSCQFPRSIEHTSLLHFVVQIVTLTSTLADTGEHGVTTMGLGDVVDQLLDKHSLSDTGTSEETNLSTTGVRGEQVDDYQNRQTEPRQTRVM